MQKRQWNKKGVLPGSREGEGGGRNGKTGITAPHCPVANPSSTPHKKKTFDTFQWLSPTLPVTPTHSGLHKLTQHGSPQLPAHRFNVFPRSVRLACQIAWNPPFIGGRGALVCYTSASPSSSLSSILHGSTLLWGPIRLLCRSMACG